MVFLNYYKSCKFFILCNAIFWAYFCFNLLGSFNQGNYNHLDVTDFTFSLSVTAIMEIMPYFLDAFQTLSIAIQFFMTEPLACKPSNLPKYPPSKEMDARRRDDEARRYECLNFSFCSVYAWFILRGTKTFAQAIFMRLRLFTKQIFLSCQIFGHCNTIGLLQW